MTEPSARVIADSISPQGHRLTSVQITAHRFILAEINTHRMLSRSYRSSHAVPPHKLIEEVRTDPALPLYWGKERKGMQAIEELDDVEDTSAHKNVGLTVKQRAIYQWKDAARNAANSAEQMSELGLHKQLANRVLEPFLWAHGIITATEWDNFFGLRLHHAAQPEFRALANAIWAAFKESPPKRLEPGEWHLPYIDETTNQELRKSEGYG